ncbi:MAG: HAMP domain-containing protein [Deltaproteobacteria bacterium]|nr:MAG: HAMP domain-containing protein [Deltaproteobacteria bacterium]
MFKTFRSNLILWNIFVLSCVLILFSGILYLTLERILHSNLDDSLQAMTKIDISRAMDICKNEEIQGLISPGSSCDYCHGGRAPSDSFKWMDRYLQMIDPSGKILYKSGNLEDRQLPFGPEILKQAINDDIVLMTASDPNEEQIRVISFPIRSGTQVEHIVQIGASLRNIKETLRELLRMLVIVGSSVLLFASLGGFFLANKALKPVDEITQTVQMIGEKSLSQRLKFKVTDDEIGRLVVVFNKMLDRLERAFESQRRFTGDVSHEIRSPLTIIKGNIEVALRKERDTDEYQRVLRCNLEEIDRIAKLVSDLLVLARADYGDFQLHIESLRLDQLLSEVAIYCQDWARHKNIELDQKIKGEISINGDKDRLRQLMLNLVENALMYTPPSGRIELLLGKEDGNARLSVKDTGIGIPEKDIPYIFDRFYRVDKNRSREQGGTGLGLSICQSIVTAHNGKIEVQSMIGKGSTFTVSLPLFKY